MRRKRLQNRWVGVPWLDAIFFGGSCLPWRASLPVRPAVCAAAPVPAASPAAQSLQSPILWQDQLCLPGVILTRPKQRSQPADRQVALDLYQQEYLSYINTPSIGPGTRQLYPGSTSTEFRQAVLRRSITSARCGRPCAGSRSATTRTQGSAAALMMSVNEALDHTPPASWTCYSDIGAEGRQR